mgnify:CR=1 FL=1
MTCEKPMESVSSGGFVRAEKSCDKNYLNFIVILVKTFMKLVPETL